MFWMIGDKVAPKFSPREAYGVIVHIEDVRGDGSLLKLHLDNGMVFLGHAANITKGL